MPPSAVTKTPVPSARRAPPLPGLPAPLVRSVPHWPETKNATHEDLAGGRSRRSSPGCPLASARAAGRRRGRRPRRRCAAGGGQGPARRDQRVLDGAVAAGCVLALGTPWRIPIRTRSARAPARRVDGAVGAVEPTPPTRATAARALVGPRPEDAVGSRTCSAPSTCARSSPSGPSLPSRWQGSIAAWCRAANSSRLKGGDRRLRGGRGATSSLYALQRPTGWK